MAISKKTFSVSVDEDTYFFIEQTCKFLGFTKSELIKMLVLETVETHYTEIDFKVGDKKTAIINYINL